MSSVPPTQRKKRHDKETSANTPHHTSSKQGHAKRKKVLPRDGKAAESGEERQPPVAAAIPPASVREVPNDGDCLFSSVADVVNSVARNARDPRYTSIWGAAKEANFRTLVTARNIRNFVTAIMKFDADEVNETLISWKEIIQTADPTVRADYSHAEVLRGHSDPTSWPARRDVMAVMRRRDLFWGEQWCLTMIERTFNIQFVVLDGRGTIQRRHEQHALFDSPNFAFLQLNHLHYRPVAFGGVFVFTAETMPRGLIPHIVAGLGADSPAAKRLSKMGM